MSGTGTSRNLELTAGPAAQLGGCGCGGCGCGGDAGTPSAPRAVGASGATASHETHGITQAYAVSGMTCGHCASAVTGELTSLGGVTDVRVELVAGGISTVTVTSEKPLDETQVATALEEAGDYSLA